MKKVIQTMLMICMVFSLVACSQEETKIEKAQGEINEIAVQFANSFIEENYEAIDKGFNYSQTMQELADSSKLSEQLKASRKLLGESDGMGNPYDSQQFPYTVVAVPLKFKNQNLNINVVFDADKNIAGVNMSEYGELVELNLPENAQEIAIEIPCSDGKTLPGTLTLPGSEKNYPVVVLVHGSGANDRDEKIGVNAPFKDLAYKLAAKGIASIRYDKRTLVYANELANQYDFTVQQETSNDAVDAVAFARQQDHFAASQVIVLGHSLGGYMAPLIASESNSDKVILMAAPYQRLIDILVYQYTYLSNLDKIVTAEEQAQIDEVTQFVERVSNGIDAIKEDEPLMGGYKAYWQSFQDLDMPSIATTLTQPVLCLNGEEDYQVTMSEFNMWKEQFDNQANWTFTSFPGLTHMMTPGSLETGPSSYSTPSHVADEVIESIVSFINQ